MVEVEVETSCCRWLCMVCVFGVPGTYKSGRSVKDVTFLLCYLIRSGRLFFVGLFYLSPRYKVSIY